MRTITAPAIATTSADGQMIYAGIARGTDGQPDYHLWLVTAEPDERLNWKRAAEWAAALGDGATLPTRREQAVLYANLPEHFKADWYWSGTQYAGLDAAAWYQPFNDGHQIFTLKSAELRVRAVRRLPLE